MLDPLRREMEAQYSRRTGKQGTNLESGVRNDRLRDELQMASIEPSWHKWELLPPNHQFLSASHASSLRTLHRIALRSIVAPLGLGL
jgi:hypothetical protein